MASFPHWAEHHYLIELKVHIIYLLRATYTIWTFYIMLRHSRKCQSYLHWAIFRFSVQIITKAVRVSQQVMCVIKIVLKIIPVKTKNYT